MDRIGTAFKEIHALGVWHQGISLHDTLVDRAVVLINYEEAAPYQDQSFMRGVEERVEAARKKVMD